MSILSYKHENMSKKGHLADFYNLTCDKEKRLHVQNWDIWLKLNVEAITVNRGSTRLT